LVINGFFAGMGRHHRPVIAIAAVVLVAAVIAGAVMAPVHAITLQVLLLPLAGVGWLLAVVSAHLRRPAAFVVDSRTRSFRASPHPGGVLLAIAIMSFSGFLILGYLPDLNPLHRPLLAGAGLLGWLVWIAVSAWLPARVWQAAGVQLRPDELVVRETFGTLILPWDALAPGLPLPVASSRDEIPLTCGRPELIRRHGRIPADRLRPDSNVDMRFLARAVRYYATNPQHRPTIGTAAGYEHLLQAVSDRTSLGPQP
jgi:hypothetical protein